MKSKLLILVLLLALCALPVLAQDTTQQAGTINVVSFNGFNFTFDSVLATNVNISQFAGDPADLAQPGGPEVRHTQFLLYSQTPPPESILDAAGTIRVYNVADLTDYPTNAERFQQLQTLLNDRADLTPFMTVDVNAAGTELPFLPVFPASQVIRARAQFVETPFVRGISYITVFRQDVSPFVNNEFLYTFQGVSLDGTRYISAIFRVDASMFPTEIPADFDMDTFTAQFQAYLTESVTQLNAATPESFTPSLSFIDAVIQSFSFGGGAIGDVVATVPTIVASPTQVQDPTLGGLAGSWNLVSYGAPEAPQAVLPNAAITITFEPTGVSGSSGCNTYGGAFEYNNGTLRFFNVAGTLIACAEDINAQEAAYMSALNSATSYQVAGNMLFIAYEGGMLTFINPAIPTATVAPTIDPALITPTATTTATTTP